MGSSQNFLRTLRNSQNSARMEIFAHAGTSRLKGGRGARRLLGPPLPGGGQYIFSVCRGS